MFSLPDPNQVSSLIRRVAEREILPRFNALEAGDIREKSPGDLVTTADVEAEKALSEGLRQIIPGSLIVGEEACEDDPAILDCLKGDKPVWIIDPIDGTGNFSRGQECFAVIVALCWKGRTRAGWIHGPIENITAWAFEGMGAFINDERLYTTEAQPIDQMRGSVGYALQRRLKSKAQFLTGNPPKKLVRYRCVGWEYIDLARGKLDFAKYGRRLKPWDHAAGILIHQEAGGYSALVSDGSPYNPGLGIIPDDALIMAPNSASWKTLHQLIGRG